MNGLLGLGLLAGAAFAGAPKWVLWTSSSGKSRAWVLLDKSMKVRTRSRDVVGRFSIAEQEGAMGNRYWHLMFFDDGSGQYDLGAFRTLKGAQRRAEKLAARGVFWTGGR